MSAFENSKLAFAALCTLAPLTLTACDEWLNMGKDWEPEPPQPAVEDTAADAADPSSTHCAWDWDLDTLGGFSEPLYAVCIHSTDVEAPMGLTLDVPCPLGQPNPPPFYTYLTNYQTSDNSSGSLEVMNEVDHQDGAQMCLIGEGAGHWHASFRTDYDITCDTYLKTGVSYVTQDSKGLLHSDDEDCKYENNIYAAYLSASYPKVDSSSAECTPGSATFKMKVRAADSNTGDATVWLAPIAETQARFPERAWLRSVEVLDWGTLSNLRVARYQEHLLLKTTGVVGGRALSAPATTFSFPVGAAPMSTMFATDHVVLDDNVRLPEVKLSWSCEQNPSNPHYRSIGQGFVGTPLAAFGSPQRVVLWPDWSNRMLRIAPEGRFVDYVPAHLKMTGANSATFTVKLPNYNATLSATIRQTGNTVFLTSTTLKIGDVVKAIPDGAYQPL